MQSFAIICKLHYIFLDRRRSALWWFTLITYFDKASCFVYKRIFTEVNTRGRYRADAMEIYDSIIRDEPNNGQILKVDWNNKEVCYLRILFVLRSSF